MSEQRAVQMLASDAKALIRIAKLIARTNTPDLNELIERVEAMTGIAPVVMLPGERSAQAIRRLFESAKDYVRENPDCGALRQATDEVVYHDLAVVGVIPLDEYAEMKKGELDTTG